MEKLFLIISDTDHSILGCMHQDDPDAGPILPQHDAPLGYSLVEAPAEGFTRAGHRDTEVAYWLDGQVQWVDTQVLSDAITEAIGTIDSTADKVRAEVISRQTNTLEYTRAEIQARAFKAAGYPADNVPSSVSSWAEAKHRDNWTVQEAADDIIATADDWYGLLDGIRRLRLIAKEDVRHCADNAAVDARVAQFGADMASLIAQ